MPPPSPRCGEGGRDRPPVHPRVPHDTVKRPPPAVPALPRHEVVDLALREGARRIEVSYMAWIEYAREAIDGQYYVKYGFTDPDPYFDERIRVSYRTVRRRLSILEGLLRLPASEQAGARAALAEVGSHKAGEIARILGRDQGAPWTDLVELARTMSEAALREEISVRLGTRPRGLPAGHPGDRFLRFLLANVPPSVKDHVEQTLAALMRHYEMKNAVSAFLLLVDLGAEEAAAWEKPRESADG